MGANGFDPVLLRQINAQLARVLIDLADERAIRVATVPSVALADCLFGIDACTTKISTARTALALAIAAVDQAKALIGSHG